MTYFGHFLLPLDELRLELLGSFWRRESQREGCLYQCTYYIHIHVHIYKHINVNSNGYIYEPKVTLKTNIITITQSVKVTQSQ